MSRYPKLKGFIFIVTYGRSGSTVLQSILQTIPRSHISGENYNALYGLHQSVASVRRTKRIWGKKERAANHPWYMADTIDPNRFAHRLTKVFVEEVIRPPTDVTWIGFKEIRYPQTNENFERLLNFMRKKFPNSYIVLNSRRTEDVVKSKWWAKKPEAEVTRLIKGMDGRFASYAEKYPDSCFHVHHQETVLGAQNLLPLFEALGEEMDQDRVNSILSLKLKH